MGALGPPTGLRDGETLVDGSVFGSTYHEDGVSGGRIAVDRSLAPGFGIRTEGYYAHDDAASDGMGAVRTGVRITPSPHFEIHAGGGAGAAGGGGFAGGDLGLVLGYVNPYVVPYLGFRGSLAAPLSQSRVVKEGVSFRRQPSLEYHTELGLAVAFTPRQVNEVAMHLSTGAGGSVILDDKTAPQAPSGTFVTVQDDAFTFQLTLGLRVRFGNVDERRSNVD